MAPLPPVDQVAVVQVPGGVVGGREGVNETAVTVVVSLFRIPISVAMASSTSPMARALVAAHDRRECPL